MNYQFGERNLKKKKKQRSWQTFLSHLKMNVKKKSRYIYFSAFEITIEHCIWIKNIVASVEVTAKIIRFPQTNFTRKEKKTWYRHLASKTTFEDLLHKPQLNLSENNILASQTQFSMLFRKYITAINKSLFTHHLSVL